MAPALDWKSPKVKPYLHTMGSGMVIGNLGQTKNTLEIMEDQIRPHTNGP